MKLVKGVILMVEEQAGSLVYCCGSFASYAAGAR
jgi:hypothetical protein